MTVVAYEDRTHGVTRTAADGGGQLERVTLRPQVTVTADSDVEVARRRHADVPGLCFIARSVSFPVERSPPSGRVRLPRLRSSRQHIPHARRGLT